MSVFDAVKYGWGVNWCLLVEGIPIAFVERLTGLSLPSGWTTESATLALDDSEIGSQVDRLRGIGCGLDLGFRLMDSTQLTALMRSPVDVAQLVTAVDGGPAPLAELEVDSQSGWDASGSLYCGLERMDYDHLDGTTEFHVLTRGVCSEWAWPHQPGTASSWVSSTPKLWRGRDVRLYACPVDPAGYPSGTTLIGEAQMVWRGKIDGGPKRVPGGFGFTAVSLDRLLDRPFAGSVSGTVVPEVPRWRVNGSHLITVRIDRYDVSPATPTKSVQLVFAPFNGLVSGTYYTAAHLMETFSDNWALCVSNNSEAAYVGDVEWPTGPAEDHVRPVFTLLDPATSKTAYVKVVVDGAPGVVTSLWGTTTDEDSLEIPLTGTVMHLSTFGADLTKFFSAWTSAVVAVVSVDEGTPSDIPETGVVRIGEALRWYEDREVVGSRVLLGQVHDKANPLISDIPGYDPPPIVPGDAVEFLFASTQGGSPATLMLEALESSGDSGLRGTNDTLARGQGYSIDDGLIDTDSFEGGLPDPLSALACTVSHSGSSWADLFGPLLALGQRAVVCRRNVVNDDMRLTVVDTGPACSAWVKRIVTADLLGLEDDPVQVQDRADPPNRFTIERKTAFEDDPDRFVVNDLESIDAVGCNEVTWSIPAESTAGFGDTVKALCASWFASDLVAQAVTLRVGPWVDVHVGDAVDLDIEHPTLWTWSSGEQGYDGQARCVARTINPRTLVVTLTLLVDGMVLVEDLSPSALVALHTNGGMGGTIDTVTIADWFGGGGSYYAHFAAALAQAGGAIKCLTYLPGDPEDDEANYVTVSSIATGEGAANLVLNVTGWTGEPIDTVTIADWFGGGGSYYAHFAAALAQAGAAIKCLTYLPGDPEDDEANYVTVSSIATGEGAANLVLNVTGWTGEPIENGTTRLTLPKLTGAVPITAYQAGYAHDADGTFWL